MLRIICFAEAPADARLASELGDRVMVEEGPDWVETELLDALRRWMGLDDGQPSSNPDQPPQPLDTALWPDKEHGPTFTKWTALKQHGRRRGRPRYIGHHSSGPRGSDYAQAVTALRAVSLLRSGGDQIAVVMLRDRDSVDDARAGLFQAAADPRFARLITIIGIQDKMRESWVLSGWQPASEAEEALLAERLRALGFDPTAQPERLRDSRDGAPRCPKTVIRQLTGGDWAREACCWREQPLDHLRERGRSNGLAAFITALAEKLPVLIGLPPGPAED